MLCFYHNVKHNEYRIFHAKCSNNKLTFKGVCPWTKCLVVVKKRLVCLSCEVERWRSEYISTMSASIGARVDGT
jgi:hypothetical protein